MTGGLISPFPVAALTGVPADATDAWIAEHCSPLWEQLSTGYKRWIVYESAVTTPIYPVYQSNDNPYSVFGAVCNTPTSVTKFIRINETATGYSRNIYNAFWNTYNGVSYAVLFTPAGDWSGYDMSACYIPSPPALNWRALVDSCSNHDTPGITDTGLGWSAKDEWLVLSPGKYWSIGQWSGAVELPVVGSAVDTAINGYVVGTRIWGSNPATVRAGATSPESFIYIVNTGFRLLSQTENTTLYIVIVDDITGEIKWSPDSIASSPVGEYWFATPTGIQTQGTLPPEIDACRYQSNSDALNALTFTETGAYYKLYTGYAVACAASWYDPEGNVITSPVLISTNPNNVILSTDGVSPTTSEVISVLYEGLNFYMSYIPEASSNPRTPTPFADLRQFAAAYAEKIFKLLASASYSNIQLTGAPPDPYEIEGQASEPGGGDGEEDTEDDVEHTDPPSTSIGATGFITIFTPTLSELQGLASFMWSSFDVDNWRKLFANPMDAILGLHIIPVPAYVAGTKAVKVGGIDTTIDMSYTTIRYIRRSMGTCYIPHKWEAYLDYSPYTRFSIYLPYIGFRELDADDIMGKTLDLQYMIDILSGACVAELMCGDSVLYVWEGNCANQVPITGTSWNGAIASALGIAGSLAAGIIGGTSAPMVAGTIASTGTNSMNLKPTVSRSGSISGSGGFMSNQRPYIIRNQPNLTIPASQNRFIGYPSFVTVNLSNLAGYNEISSVHLENIPATQTELNEIETLLKGGVIF